MKKCDSYHTRPERHYIYDMFTGAKTPYTMEVGECWGTMERDRCDCGGDRSKCDFYDYIRKEAFEPKFGEWISVDDMLPEIETTNIKEYSRHYSKSVRVLCVCKQKSGKVMVKEGYYETSSDGKRIYWKIPGSIDSVTHWMPLPEPPMEDE